jgi:hypothetical protein
MGPFRQWLMDKHPAENVEDYPIVSLALIDDGIDGENTDIPFIWNGNSFYAEGAKAKSYEEYHSGPSPHGTKMAMCINQVCPSPMVKLYVARMDDSVPGQRFTVQSAIEVGRVLRPVSMSWLPAFLGSWLRSQAI